MKAISLQSGSSGNCIYVESGGARLLFDAGISGVRAERSLMACGLDIREVDAVVISHDHSDHAHYAGVYQRKFGLPVYATRRTMQAASSKYRMGRMRDVRHFRAGETLRFGNVSVHTIPTAHDGADGVAFVLSSAGRRLGILTDLGHPFRGLDDVIASLDAVFMESNHDHRMLLEGPYPPFLKERISGPGGHLSNAEAAGLLASSGRRLRWACLSHLSEQNNRPDLALEAHRRVIGRDLPLYTASRTAPTGVFTL
jgi:phosphoribosyl 1,2-cyclic phosphodiesterase